jgi:hypothetical protein
MERYIKRRRDKGGGDRECLIKLIWARKIAPVLCGAASVNVGIQVADGYHCKNYPSPLYKAS